MSFDKKLYQHRKEKGLSQEALAEQLNTTRQAISKWENGQGFPEIEKLVMLSHIFGVSIDYLIKDSPSGNEQQNSGSRWSAGLTVCFANSVYRCLYHEKPINDILSSLEFFRISQQRSC